MTLQRSGSGNLILRHSNVEDFSSDDLESDFMPTTAAEQRLIDRQLAKSSIMGPRVLFLGLACSLISVSKFDKGSNGFQPIVWGGLALGAALVATGTLLTINKITFIQAPVKLVRFLAQLNQPVRVPVISNAINAV